jgi:predicted nucleic acid-binding protein
VARIFWDTNLFIYLFEGEGSLNEQVKRLRHGLIARGDQIYTSAMTVGEILVRPVNAGSREIEQRYLEFFRGSRVHVVAFDVNAAPYYARVRQDKTIRPADAIQLACASAAKIDLFITNDDRLSKKIVPGIQFITSLARAPI